eukprot:gnl/Hemi2/14397_TR4873_c0_g1_i1.p1 gnl/Hemi2/14397_TR4873_c0_g1~~gnl/Hemi2/14397_TR4873_c0_g1_i1.p1  ORF type:complete len:866 (+),score=351.93 gnl/Hemi2/14397_TR4873_c0_g1_i1:89-2686(+)
MTDNALRTALDKNKNTVKRATFPKDEWDLEDLDNIGVDSYLPDVPADQFKPPTNYNTNLFDHRDDSLMTPPEKPNLRYANADFSGGTPDGKAFKYQTMFDGDISATGAYTRTPEHDGMSSRLALQFSSSPPPMRKYNNRPGADLRSQLVEEQGLSYGTPVVEDYERAYLLNQVRDREREVEKLGIEQSHLENNLARTSQKYREQKQRLSADYERKVAQMQDLHDSYVEQQPPLYPPPVQGVPLDDYTALLHERAWLLQQLEVQELEVNRLHHQHHRLEDALDRTSINFKKQQELLQSEFEQKMKKVHEIHSNFLQEQMPVGMPVEEYNDLLAERSRLTDKLEAHERQVAHLQAEHRCLESNLDHTSTNFKKQQDRLQAEFEHKMASMHELHNKYLADFKVYQQDLRKKLASQVQAAKDELNRLSALQDQQVEKVVKDVDSHIQSVNKRYKDGVSKLDHHHAALINHNNFEKDQALKDLRKKGKAQLEQLSKSQKAIENDKDLMFRESVDTMRALREQKSGVVEDLRTNTHTLAQLSVTVDHTSHKLESLSTRLDGERAKDLKERDQYLEDREVLCKSREETLFQQEQQGLRLNKKLSTLYLELQESLQKSTKTSGDSQQQLVAHMASLRTLQELITEERINGLQEIARAQNNLQVHKQRNIREREQFVTDCAKERKRLDEERQRILSAQAELTADEQDRARKCADAEAILNAQRLKLHRERSLVEEQRQTVAQDKDGFTEARRRFDAERAAFNAEAKRITDLGLQVQRKFEAAQKQLERNQKDKKELLSHRRQLEEEHVVAVSEANEVRDTSGRLKQSHLALQKELTDLTCERKQLQQARNLASQSLSGTGATILQDITPYPVPV